MTDLGRLQPFAIVSFRPETVIHWDHAQGPLADRKAVVRIRVRKVCALGQKVLAPSTSPASHLSQRPSRGHLLHRRRASSMMAIVGGSPSVAIPGFRPTRIIMPLMRLAEAAAWLDCSHMMVATATPSMIMATLICGGPRI